MPRPELCCCGRSWHLRSSASCFGAGLMISACMAGVFLPCLALPILFVRLRQEIPVHPIGSSPQSFLSCVRQVQQNWAMASFLLSSVSLFDRRGGPFLRSLIAATNASGFFLADLFSCLGLSFVRPRPQAFFCPDQQISDATRAGRLSRPGVTPDMAAQSAVSGRALTASSTAADCGSPGARKRGADLAGLITPGRHAEVCCHRRRLLKSRWILDARHIGQGNYRANARSRHQLAGSVVAASTLNHCPVVHEDLGPRCFQHLQHGRDDRLEHRMSIDRRAYTRRELAAQAFGQYPTEGL